MSPDTGHRASFSETRLQSRADKLATQGEKDAIVFFERGREERWSYAQLADHTERLAHGLAAGGIGRGERLAIWAHPCGVVGHSAGNSVRMLLTPFSETTVEFVSS